MSVSEHRPLETKGLLRPAAGAHLPDLQRAILQTVIYSDLFDYPLTEDELYRYLVLACPSLEFERALAELVGEYLTRIGPLITMAGREHIVHVRRRREQTAGQGWAQARRYAHLLTHVPFVRMVAVCGSQAAGNASADADVDIFLVTEGGRLWTVQVLAMLLRRVVSRASVRVCPNYLLSLDSLEVQPQNLYSAREAVQAEPLWGADTYAAFLHANRWLRQFLPHALEASGRGSRLQPVHRPRLTRLLERFFGGRLGDVLDRVLFRLLMLYYPLRLRHLGWRKEQFRRAYRRDQQVVMQGGYGPAVARVFRDRVVSCFGEPVASRDLARLFPVAAGLDEKSPEPDRLYARLFAERYGSGHE